MVAGTVYWKRTSPQLVGSIRSLTCPASTAPLFEVVSLPAVSFLQRCLLWLGLRLGLIGLRLNGKRMGRSDRAHAGFYRAGYLLEDLAGLAPTENLRSDCFVLGHERHSRLVPTLVINPSGRPSGCAMHSEGIANGLGADAKGRCDGLIAIATNLFFCWPEPFCQPATLIIHTARIARAVQRAVRSQFDATSFTTNSGGCPSRSSRACSGI